MEKAMAIPAEHKPSSEQDSQSDIEQNPVTLKPDVQVQPPATAAPNGGLQAWLQVLGAFFLFFSSWGLVVAFGAYQDYLETTLLKNYSPSDIAWIGTTQGFLLIVFGVFTGPIYDLGYLRHLVISGTILNFVGLMTASVSTEYYQLFLSLGVAVGLGSGCLFVPSVAIVAQWFTTKRAAATGLTASGGSVGGIIFPIAFRKLANSIGFGWANRILAFIVLATLLVPIFVLKPRAKPAKKRSLFELRAFTDPAYVLFSLALFFTFVGLYIPFFYVATYARTKLGLSEDFSFYLIAILNAASVFGRIIPNILADKLGSLRVLLPCTAITGVLGLAWMGVQNLPGLIVFCILYGFFSGAIVSLPPTALVTLSPNLSVVGTRMGMSFSFAGFGLLIGSPAAGALLKSKASFMAVEGFCGAFVFAGFLVFVLSVVAHKKNGKK